MIKIRNCRRGSWTVNWSDRRRRWTRKTILSRLRENADSWNDGDSRLLEEDVDPEEYDELKSLEKDAVDSEGEEG